LIARRDIRLDGDTPHQLLGRPRLEPRAGTQPIDLDIGVIYTWERELMPPLLSTLRGSGDDLRMRLVLVDNASADGVSQWERHFSRVHVVINERRLSYAANMNRILEASTAPFVLLLNTDMFFVPEEQCLSKMVRFMREHPQCGVAGCRLYHPAGDYAFPARRFPTLPMIVARRFPFWHSLSGYVHDYLYLERDIHGVFACDWLSGCFLLVRREAVENVGMIDPQFEKYFEDVDICRRMTQHGWQVLFNGDTFGYHIEQRASRKMFSRDSWTHINSYRKWLWKWRPLGPARTTHPRPHWIMRPARHTASQRDR
jgi:GT2 family glycosyltransferase